MNRITVAAALLAILLTACGGGGANPDEPDPVDPARPTVQEVIDATRTIQPIKCADVAVCRQ